MTQQPDDQNKLNYEIDNQDEAVAEQQEQQEQLLDENGNPIDAPPEEQQEEGGRKYTGIISWVVSGALHATALLLAGTIYFLTAEPEQEIPPVRVTNIPPPPMKKDEKPKEKELLEPKVQLDLETKSDVVAPITTLDLPDEKSEREEEKDNPVPKGREEAVADSEQGGSGAFMAIGAGGGASGMFGSRTGGGRKRAVGRGGGSKGSESSVNASLRWFKKHQSPNGMWDAAEYYKNCTEDPKCEPGLIIGGSAEDINAAMTGYALLCFLGAGFDHISPNTYKSVVKKGVDYLVSVQAPDGMIGKRNYEHPVAVMALAEAYAMTSDPNLRQPAQKGIDQIIKRQNQDKGYGMGWDYTKPTNRNDTSVTGWNVMALKSAHAGGLNIGTSMEGAKIFLEKSWQAANTDQPWCKDYKSIDPYKDISRYPYTWDTASGKIEIAGWANDKPTGNPDSKEMAPVGLVLAVFLGHRAGDPMLESLANYVMKFQTPTKYPANTYYMYYNTLGVFQIGGEKWKVWNSVVRDMLVKAQRSGDGCFDGSWDYKGIGFYGSGVGRVLSTAYNTLCLEVYYRYAQVNQKH